MAGSYPLGMDRGLFRGALDGESSGDASPEVLRYSTRAKLSRAEAVVCRKRMHWAEEYYKKRWKKHWERSDKLYRGEHWNKALGNAEEHRLVINYIRHIVTTRVESATFSDAEIILRPQTPLGDQNLQTAHHATVFQYKEANAQRELKRAFHDMNVFGFGVVMTGWEYQVEDAPPVEGRPEDGPEEGAQEFLGGSEPEPDLNVLKDGCYCRRLDPRDFRVSPEATWVLDDAPFCGYVEWVELSEVRADPRYKGARSLKGTSSPISPYLDERDRKESEEDRPNYSKRVKLIHYYEKQRRLHVVFAEEREQPLLVEKWPWEHGHYPFDCMFAERSEDDFYPIPTPVESWEHMQREINATRSQLMNVRQQMVPKWITTKGLLQGPDKERMKSGQIGTVIEANHPNPSAAIGALPLPQLSPDFYNDAATALQDLSTISALGQYQIGNAPTKRLTTTEVQAITGQGGVQKDASRREFEKACAAVAGKFLSLLQQYWDKTAELPIYERGELRGWTRPFTRNDILGDFQFDVHVGSTEIKTQQGRVEELGYLIQSLSPLIQMGVVNPAPLVKQLLANMPDIRDVEQIVASPGGGAVGGGGTPGQGPPLGLEGMEIPPDLLQQLGPMAGGGS